MTKDKRKSEAAKRNWDRIRQVAQEQGVSVQEARKIIAAEKNSPSMSPQKEKPVATAPAKEPAKKKPNKVDLVEAEKKLREKYPHVIPGTLQLPAEGSRKRSCEIACQEPGCKARRRVYTSDLFQVKYCVQHSKRRKKKEEK